MEQISYDPVLGQEEIQPFRLFKPIQPPEHGTAMVLEPLRGSAVPVRPGEAVPDARFGAYQRMSLVDTTEHRLAFAVALVSRDPAFGFRAGVSLSCRVIDPVAVVERGIRDMAPTLKGPMHGMLRSVSRRYDIGEFHECEQALNEALSSFHGDSAIALRRIVVELQLDEEELTTGGRAYRDKLRQQRLDFMSRSHNLKLLREEGPEALIAGMLEREGDRAVLEWIRSEESADRAELMRALEVVMGHNEGEREPFDTAEIERTIVDRLVDSRSRTAGGIGRVRGTIGSGDAPEPRSAKAIESFEEPAGHTIPARKTEGADFIAEPPSEPPEDEPLPAPGGVEGKPRTSAPPPARAERPSSGGSGSPRASRVRGVRPRPDDGGRR
ncbi:hypothetical protein [Nocardiopsis oceani]